MAMRTLLFGKDRFGTPHRHSPRRTASRRSLTLHALEERCVPSGYVWTQRGGDAGHTGYVDVAVNGAGITDAWNQPINYASSGYWAQSGNRAVAIDDTRVYRTELDGYWASGNYHVMAYDLQTGGLLWNQVIVGNGPVSAPSVADGNVYINRSGHSGISGGTDNDKPWLYQLNASSGSTVTRATYAAQWSSDERPTIAGNQLVTYNGYYGGMGSWSVPGLAPQWNRGGSIYENPSAAMDSNYIYAFGSSTYSSNTQVFSRATGSPVATLTHPTGMWTSDPVVSGTGMLLLNVAGTVGGVQKYGVAAFDAATRSLLWTAYTSTYVAGKAVGNGIVAVTSGQQLIFLNEATGAVTRTWQAPANLTGQLVLTRTHAFVEVDGYPFGPCVAHAVNLATAQSEWSYQNNVADETNSTFMELAFGGGRLILSHDTFVRAFAVGEGTNQPPDAVDDIATTAEDTPVSIPVLGNDTDPDGNTLSVTGAGGAAHGSVVVNANGTVTYTPHANYSGPDSFTYAISDGHGGADSATVQVTVTPANDPPTAESDSFATDEDATLTVGTALGVLANDSDQDGDPLTAVLVSGPSQGTLTLNANGSFTYTPNANVNGTDSFTYKANDGGADSNVATVTIAIHAVQDPPVANAGPNQSADEVSLVAFNGAGSFDVDGDSLNYAWDFGDGTTGSGPNPTHTFADSGSYTVTLTADDGHGNSNSDTLLLTVNNVAPTATASGPASAVRGQIRPFTFTAADVSAVDQAAPLTYAINWGDGSDIQPVQGPASGLQVDHVFVASGNYTVAVTAIDKDGGQSPPASRAITIKAIELQGDNLVVGGTPGDDTILIKPGDRNGNLSITMDGTSVLMMRPTGQLQVFAQAGNDTLRLQTAKIGGFTRYVNVPALLFGGAGDDTVDARGSKVSNVLLGGEGVDSVSGGIGREFIVGGLGADILRGRGQQDILLGGTTNFDTNLGVLTSLLAEWNRRDLTYAARINHLTGATPGGLNGTNFLTASMLQDDAAADQLYGGMGQDWFLYRATGLGADLLKDKKSNERATTI